MNRVMINGNMVDQLNVMDRGLQYGDGVFETMRVSNNKIPLWEKHWHRLQAGCQRLAIALPGKQEIESSLADFLTGISQGVVKLVVTRGVSGRGYAINPGAEPSIVFIQSELPGYPQDYYSNGVQARICQVRLARQPLLAGIKHLNRLEQVMARNEWNDSTIIEGIMLDTEDNVIEGIISNLFLVRDNSVITPELSMCGVAGVMRQAVIELLEKESISFDMRPVTKDELFSADEVFITNSVFGLWPVKKINDTVFKTGEITGLLQNKVRRIFTDA